MNRMFKNLAIEQSKYENTESPIQTGVSYRITDDLM